MFHAGQKVVCVDDGTTDEGRYIWIPGEELVVDRVYTVHSTFTHHDLGVPMLRLLEVKRSKQCITLWGHDGYGARRFRPLVDISFTEGADASTRKYDNRRKRKVTA